jgi:hypothetical protein
MFQNVSKGTNNLCENKLYRQIYVTVFCRGYLQFTPSSFFEHFKGQGSVAAMWNCGGAALQTKAFIA